MNQKEIEIKNRIRKYMMQRELKATAIKKLKKEFGVNETYLSDLWIEVKKEGPIKRADKAKKEDKVFKVTKEELIPGEEITAGMIKQSLGEAADIKPIERKFETKCGVFTKDKEGVTFEGLTFKSKEDIQMYRDIINTADLVMDMEV